MQAIRVGQLRKAEEQARAHLHPSVRKITDGKETLATKEILVNNWYPDPEVADCIREATCRQVTCRTAPSMI